MNRKRITYIFISFCIAVITAMPSLAQDSAMNAGKSVSDTAGFSPEMLMASFIIGSVFAFFISGFFHKKKSARKYDVQRKDSFRIFFDLAPYSCTLHSMEGRYIMVNRSFCEGTGYTEEDVIGKTMAEAGISTTNSGSVDAMAMLAETGQAIGIEASIITKSGETKDSLYSSRIIEFESQKVIFSVTVDITDLKKAEKALRDSESRFRKLFRLAPVPLSYVSDKGFVLDINEMLIKELGYTIDDIPTIDAWWTRAYPDETYRKSVIKAWNDSICSSSSKGGMIEGNEYNVTCRNGNVKIMKINGMSVNDGFIVSFQDITERKLHEQRMALRESDLRYRNDNLQSLLIRGKLFLDDFNNAIQEITRIGSQILGTERVSIWLYSDDYQTIKCIDLFSLSTGTHSSGEELRASEFPSYTETQLKGNNVAVEDVFSDPRTKEIPASYYNRHEIVSLLDVPIWFGEKVKGIMSFEASRIKRSWSTEDEHVASTLATFVTLGFEINERRRAQEEREKLQGQLVQAQKMEAVGRLAGGVAHDFNNMLTAIIGLSELSLMDEEVPETIVEYLQIIRDTADRSADLTRQLLGFARKQTIAPKNINLNSTITDMLSMLKRIIGEDIDLSWAPLENLWTVRMDPSQLDQILVNLCVNARDAIPGAGKITIETDNAVFDKAYCDNNVGFTPGNYVRLAVSDDGYGMDKETMQMIFEPFFTTKQNGKGTGLGLATVFGIVKQNNGFVNVYSELGKGTTFRIYLPRFEEMAESSAESYGDVVMMGSQETILLVEDDPVIMSVTKRMLEQLCYRVFSASSPNEAIKIAEEISGIDLLLTDVVMPDMNGKELSSRILAIQPGVRCLFMSGYTANVIAHRGVLDDGVNFLPKPFSLQGLSSKVRAVISE